jgi:cell division protein FtsW (lipid II flippase)
MNRLEKLLKAILATVGTFMVAILIALIIHFMSDIGTDIILVLVFILVVFYFYIIQKDESPNN